MRVTANKISVIIPTFNRAHTLSRALDSVLQQTITVDEIIVVDDGSTDKTEKLISGHYPTVNIIQQSNQGVSHARNTGISNAGGDWIALLDSDDSWQPEKLARQFDLLHREAGCKLCHCDEIWIRNGKRVNPHNKHAKQGGWIFQHCLPLCAISPSAALIHRSLFDEIGLFDESLPACEDYDFWLRVTARYPVYYLPEKLVNKYGGHNDQLSRKYWGMDRFRIQALENILSYTQLRQEDKSAALKMLINKLEIMLLGAEKRNNQEIISCYRKKLYHYQKFPQLCNSNQSIQCL